MPLRIGFDLDGVLADFASAYRDVESRLFGPVSPSRPDDPEVEERRQDRASSERRGHTGSDGAPGSPVATGPDRRQRTRRRRDLIWEEIESTPDFWMTLRPTEEGAVQRVHELMLLHRWEVFFITQRPATEGQTVQRQTQHWLVRQGFDLPSVLVLGGSRGAAAGALRLDYHVDDSPQNCLDVLSDSRAKTILILPDDDLGMRASARKLGIGTVPSIGGCLRVLEEATLARTHPTLLERLATLVGWR